MPWEPIHCTDEQHVVSAFNSHQPKARPRTPRWVRYRNCAICCQYGLTTRHHILPASEGGQGTPTVRLCEPCHDAIHVRFTNLQLARTPWSFVAAIIYLRQ